MTLIKPTVKTHRSQSTYANVVLFLWASAGSAWLGGCTQSLINPEGTPTIRGVIRGPGEGGSLMIVAEGDSLSCDVSRRAQVRIGGAKISLRSGREAPSGSLLVGSVVAVWTSGLILDVCPGIVSATHIVIEEPPP